MKALKTNSSDDLKQNDDRFSLVMKGINDGLWDWNLLTNEVYYSAKWKSMLGYKEHELENCFETWENLVDSEDKIRALEKVQDCLDNDLEEFELEMKMNHKNGSKVIVLSRGFFIKDETSGESIRLIGTHIDITERKKSEEFIHQTNSILEMIAIGKPASNVYDAIALMYENRHPGMRCSLLELEDGKLLHGGAPSIPEEYCNAVHGLEIGPAVGSCGTSTYTGKRVLVENIETDPKWENIKKAALPHGMRSCWSEPIIDSTGKVLGAFGMYYDYPALPTQEESNDLLSAARLTSIVMERDQSQKRIYKDQEFIAEQSKLASMGEMIGNIAHQWRQPLSVITTIASGFKLEDEHGIVNPDNISSNMNEIIKQANYLSHTVDDFRSFIKNSKNKEPLSLVSVLESSLTILDASLKNNYVKVVSEFTVDIKIQGLKNELTQAFINIITNAKDALVENISDEEDRYIFVSTKEIDSCLMIEIKDTGFGIDENIINRIFEPYFTTKHKSIGTGIGLSMAHQIITKRHDGHISIINTEFSYDNKKYKGACFRIYLS
ncbi:ATP-binding protein [Arcobacter sp. LA11]|uniref:PAS domain-containing sensor histidine kinase n=1 Tax=Arcobacter sp. LA11 TaxID=1898176 RepID=UPI0009349597|nr:ATP-binding protein [Arcobacter sp. LA11]